MTDMKTEVMTGVQDGTADEHSSLELTQVHFLENSTSKTAFANTDITQNRRICADNTVVFEEAKPDANSPGKQNSQ